MNNESLTQESSAPTKEQKEELAKELAWQKDRGFALVVIDGPYVITEGDQVGQRVDRRWHVKVSLGSMKCSVKEMKNGFFQLDAGGRGKGQRPACGTQNINEAIFFAENFIDRKREFRTVNEVVQEVLARDKQELVVADIAEFLHLTEVATWKTFDDYHRRCKLAEFLFGSQTPLSAIKQKHVDKAVARSQKGIPELGGRLGRPVKANTAVERVQDFGTCITKVSKLDPEDLGFPAGFTLVPRHPLITAQITWPDKGTDARREAATPEMFGLLMDSFTYVNEGGEHVTRPAPVDAVDPTGELRMFVAILYYTGRRVNAVVNLTWEDLVTDKDIMREVLREAPFTQAAWAEDIDLLVNFEPGPDKEDHHWPIPGAQQLQVEVAVYRARTKRHVGPLFPGVKNQFKCASSTHFCKAPQLRLRKRKPTWFSMGLVEQAVYKAIEYLETAGRRNDIGRLLKVRARNAGRHEGDQRWIELDTEHPIRRWAILQGHKNHIWRHCHATQMDALGWSSRDKDEGVTLDVYASYMGSWAPSGKRTTLEEVYRHMNPKMLVECANWVPAWEAQAKVGVSRALEIAVIQNAVVRHAEALLRQALG